MSDDPAPNPRLRILLVEDEPTIAITLGDELESAGNEVLTCGDGLRAIEELSRSAFDLVITDLRLPGAGGASVLAAARRDGALVIVISAHVTEQQVAELRHAGAAAVFQKPFENEDLVSFLSRSGERCHRDSA